MQIEEDKIKTAIYCQLIQNSEDFLISAATALKDNNNKGLNGRIFSGWDGHNLKSAFLSCTTAIELLLKAIIFHHDWRLIFEKPRDANINSINTGEFNSIRLSKCTSLINKTCIFQIEQRFVKKIEFIGKERNKLVHCKNDDFENNSIEFISKGIDVYLEIYNDFITSIGMPNNLSEIDFSLIKIDKYVQIRVRSIQYRLINMRRPESVLLNMCPQCGIDSLVFKNEDYVHCLFCHYLMHIEEISFTGAKGLKCPKCGKETMHDISNSFDNKKSHLNCINCNYIE